MLDLIVVERKLNKVKVAVCILIILAIIASIIGSIFIKKSKNNMNNFQEEIIQQNQIVEQQEKQQAVKKQNIVPILTEKGKENIENIYHLEEKTAYLTFDDGPSKSVTPLILDVLKQKDIKATFFVLGSRVELYPEVVKRAYEEGHYIANHGYSHLYSSIYSSAESVLNEYLQTEEVIKNALEVPEYNSHLFRFPGGSVGGKYSDIKQEAISLLEENDIVYVDWNALTNDSVGNPTKEQMMEYLVSTVGQKSNVVILMHDAGDKILTYELLPEIIDFLIEQGYTFKNFYNIIQ